MVERLPSDESEMPQSAPWEHDIFHQAMLGAALALVSVVALAATYWRWFGLVPVLVWIAVYVVLTLGRIHIRNRLTIDDLTNQNSLYWRVSYPIGTNLSALWGGLGTAWVVWRSPPEEQFLLWLITFVTAASLLSLYSVVKTRFITTPLMLLIPPVVVAVIQEHPHWQMLSWFTVILGVLLLLLFRSKARLFTDMIDDNAERNRQVESKLRAQANLLEAERDISALMDNLRDLIYRFNVDGTILKMSSSCERLLGYLPDELVGRNLIEFLPRSEIGVDMQRAVVEMGFIENYVHPMLRKDGVEIWLSVNATLKHDANGEAYVEGTSRDITEARNTRIALKQAERKAGFTLAAISDGVIAVTAYGIVDYLNPVAESLTGWTAEDAVGQKVETVLELREERTMQRTGDPVKRCLRDGGAVTLGGESLVIHRSNGKQRKVEVAASPIRDNLAEVTGVVLILHDITRIKTLTRELSYQASHDQLTGLVNRAEFEVRLRDALESCIDSGVEHSLLYMDLDQFKVVNDSCGHSAGDELLRRLAKHLLRAVRETDTLARLGGDEFGLLLDSCSLANAVKAAENVLESVKAFRFHWEGRIFDLGISIGAVPISSDSGDLTELLKVADSACYIAKDAGRGRVHAYSPNDEQLAMRKGQAQRVEQIQRALEGEGFELVAQHIAPVDVGGDKRLGTEFLIRLRDNDGGFEAPHMFLPAAERYHLMPKIDRWVVHEAMQRIAARPHVLDDCSEYAINLSGQSLTDDGLLDYILSELDNSEVPPSSICFEITETAVIANLAKATELIGALRERGCKFALDDFGSGLSSFQYLKQLSVDKVKIDGAFVRDLANDTVDQAMVRSIVDIAREMKIETVAEYVADGDIFARLVELGVDYAQGYHVGKPVRLSDDEPPVS